MIEVIIHIANKKVLNMKEFREAFNQLKDGKHLVTVKDMRRRSVPQNAYYWSVVVPTVRKGLYEAGYDDVRTNDDAHEVMKHIFLKKKLKSKSNEDEIIIAGSTADLSVPEFNNYMEEVCKWSAEYMGVVIPSPYEQLAEFEDWKETIADEAES